MDKVPRKVQKIFGSNAGSSGITKFGSTAAGATAYSTDLDDIQSLTAYQTGWLGAVMSGTKRKPVYQDRNALDYLFSSQLANIFQDGVPVYNSATTYYIGSIVRQDTTSILYKSLIDGNIGNLLTDNTKWQLCGDLSNLSNTNSIIPLCTCTTPTNDLTLTGTVTATNGSTTVTGTSTLFTTEAPVGNTIIINGTPCYVSAVASNTSLTISQIYGNTTFTGTAYRANNAKVVALSGFTLTTGATIQVTFLNANYGQTPTLNVNSTGAKAVYSEDGIAVSAVNPSYFPAGATVEFTYNGTNWVFKKRVIENYVNGTSWYRTYSDGWIEQGGYNSVTAGTSTQTFTLLKSFKDTNYSIQILNSLDATSYIYHYNLYISSKLTTSFTTTYCSNKYWEAKGY